VTANRPTAFSRNGDLSIQHSSNPFKRHRINAETVSEWEEFDAKDGAVGIIGQAAAVAALPGRVGKAVGAGVGAAFNSGHSVRVTWVGGKQSIIGFPEKQFMVFSILLKDLQVTTELSAKPETDVPPGVAEKIAGFASTVLPRGKQKSAIVEDAPVPDAAEQIAKLASLHAQGILTDAEFTDKKVELLKRL
jgi:hypothetical protein